MRGPIDYIVVGFNSDKFDGSILKEIRTALDKKIIDLLALGAVSKDKTGKIRAFSISQIGNGEGKELKDKYNVPARLVDKEDIDEVAELLEPGTAAGILVVEQLWAKPLKKAILDKKGFLVAEGRIHPQAAQELEKVGE